MIVYRAGNLLKDDAQVLVNPVNCVGTMGKGLAKAFKLAFPSNDDEYRNRCRRHLLRPGRLFIHTLPGTTPPRYVVNFPTKDHWKDPSKIEYIDRGLIVLARTITDRKISSIALPALGTGLGGLKWEPVHQLMLHHLSNLADTEVRIYRPAPQPKPKPEGATL